MLATGHFKRCPILSLEKLWKKRKKQSKKLLSKAKKCGRFSFGKIFSREFF